MCRSCYPRSWTMTRIQHTSWLILLWVLLIPGHLTLHRAQQLTVKLSHLQHGDLVMFIVAEENLALTTPECLVVRGALRQLSTGEWMERKQCFIQDLQLSLASLQQATCILMMTPQISFHAPFCSMWIERNQRASKHGLGSMACRMIWGDHSNIQIVRLPVGPAQSAFSDIAEQNNLGIGNKWGKSGVSFW